MKKEPNIKPAASNVYTPTIAQWYDHIMGAGYLQHEQAAASLHAILLGRKNVLELGIGTGLLAQRMVSLGYQVTGVDYSPDMLKIARERLGDKVILYEQDIIHLDIPASFEAIYCESGVWIITYDNEGNMFLESHIIGLADNFTAFGKVVKTLQSGGLLILSKQPIHENMDGLALVEHALYSQKVIYELPYIHKAYFVTRNEEQLAYQENTFRRFTALEWQQLLAQNGLKEIQNNKDTAFLVYQKT